MVCLVFYKEFEVIVEEDYAIVSNEKKIEQLIKELS
jgi:hypothetical protein